MPNNLPVIKTMGRQLQCRDIIDLGLNFTFRHGGYILITDVEIKPKRRVQVHYRRCPFNPLEELGFIELRLNEKYDVVIKKHASELMKNFMFRSN